jgi:hypothetical protein
MWEAKMLVQLNPPLPLKTPKGDGLAHLVIDYGPEHDLFWVVFLDADGASWTVPNREVRMSANWTMGRGSGEAAANDEKRAPRFRPTIAAGSEN